MKKQLIILGMVLIGLISGERALANHGSPLSSTNFEEAKRKASTEGKLLFIDFYAKWCTPCKWMEQTTFTDTKVSSILNDNYIAIKVDIDELQGYELKNTYGVKYLPTMIIFNSEGQMVDRIEETVSPRVLTEILEKHNNPNNKIVIHDYNTAPTAQATKSMTPSNPTNDGMMLTKEQYMQYFKQTTTQTNYRVQVGVFEKYEGASTLVQQLQQVFMESIYVTNTTQDGKSMFKVMIGQFSTYDEAESFRLILNNDHNIWGIVQ